MSASPIYKKEPHMPHVAVILRGSSLTAMTQTTDEMDAWEKKGYSYTGTFTGTHFIMQIDPVQEVVTPPVTQPTVHTASSVSKKKTDESA